MKSIPNDAPWRVQASIPEDGFEYYRIQALGKDGHFYDIADVHGPQNTRALSNAQLMAGAPALLAASQAALNACERIVQQYGPIQCGIDFHALETGLLLAVTRATDLQPDASPGSEL